VSVDELGVDMLGGGATEECREETMIAPDPVSDLYMPELRAAPTDTHEDCPFGGKWRPS
jgi:hypothetical protein